MHKRHLQWFLLTGLLALLLSQLVVRSEWRSLFSPSYWSNLNRFGKVLRLVEAHFVDAVQVEFESLTDSALREAVRSLDPYSSYMVAEDFEAFEMSSQQRYVGVGVEIRQFSGRVVLSEVFEPGPAAGAGLRAGDFVVGVDGEDTRQETLAEVVARIRGEPGTEVVLEIERPATGRIFEARMERAAIKLDSVVAVTLRGGGVGSLRIRQFIEETDAEFAEAMKTLKAEGLRGLVIDLRGNPGGMLTTAVRLADLLLDEGRVIVSVQSRRGREEVFAAERDNDLFRGPVAVLIDGTSASASEILAGALRDHRRAVLVGETSFGKGSVQSVLGFPGGDGLKLTTARYLLPDGKAINGTGVEPDVVVALEPVERTLLLLQENHLEEMGREAFTAAFGYPPVEDHQMEAAVATVKSVLAAGPAGLNR